MEGITYPSLHGQRSLVTSVYEEVGIDPANINYIEAHVTGTTAGDPVEMNAMYDVICTNRPVSRPLYVGCLKSNMGHTEGASGLCAMAKACIIFQTKMIPPNLHYKKPNPNIRGLMDGKMVTVTKTIPFSGTLIPVNCFGFGGANAHVLTEIHDEPPPKFVIDKTIPRLVQVCGRTPQNISHIFDSLQKRPTELLNNNFLSLLNDFATIPHVHGMVYRGYAIITEDSKNYTFKISNPTRVESKLLKIHFSNSTECQKSFDFFQNVPVFKETIDDLKNVLRRNVDGDFNGSNDSVSRIILQSVGMQLALANVVRSLGILCDEISGSGCGVIAASYLDGALGLEEAILTAYQVTKSSCKHELGRSLKAVIPCPKRFSSRFKHPLLVPSNNLQLLSSPQFFAETVTATNQSSSLSLSCDSICFQVGSEGITEFCSHEHRNDDKWTDNYVINMLNSIGKMYVNGSNCKIEEIYPKVTYPMPSSTPTLSSLIKWKHDKYYSLDPFLVQCTSYHFQTSRILNYHFEKRNPEDTFLYDHKIDGRILFPATGYLMMAWIAYAKLNNTVYDCPVEFQNVSFERATVISGSELDLSCLINEDSGSFFIKDGDNLVAKGFVRFCDIKYNEPKAIRLNPPPEDLVMMPAKDIYREFRIRGYDYGQYFQGISESRSDGRSGILIWRDVLNKGLKEGMNIEFDEEHALLWLRSWTTLSDAMFQLLLMSQQDSSRNLFVPRKLESLICFPEIMKSTIASSPQYMDSLTLNTASDITAYADPDENIVWMKGMVIKGLKTSMLKRRQQFVRHKKYLYMPMVEKNTIDSEEDLKHIRNYYKDCVSWSRKVNKIVKKCDHDSRMNINGLDHYQNKQEEDMVDDTGIKNEEEKETSDDAMISAPDDERHSFLKILSSRINSNYSNDFSSNDTLKQSHHLLSSPDDEIDLSQDLLLGTGNSDWFYPEHFLKPHLELVVYDMISEGSAKIQVLEIASSNHLLSTILQSYADESLLYDQTVLIYTLLHPSPTSLEPRILSSVQKVEQFDISSLSSANLPSSHLTIYPLTQEITCEELQKRLINFHASSSDSSFLLIVTKDELKDNDIKQAVFNLKLKSTHSLSSQFVIEIASKVGYRLVSHKTLHDEILPLHSILFKKSQIIPPSDKVMTLLVGLTNPENWFEDAKSKLIKLREDPESSLWVIPDWNSRDDNNNKLSGNLHGILGFVKSMRQEAGYSNVRCLIDLESNEDVNIYDKKYGDMIQKDLVYNIYGGEKVGWLQYEHLSLPRQVHEDVNLKSKLRHVYLKNIKPGDLTSFVWAQSDFDHVPDSEFVDVHFAPLNFRDIMFATGGLQPEAIPGIPSKIAQDSILGLEFAGINANGQRVMGLVPYKAIASTVIVSDTDLIWPVPESWSLEEAATVPCVYATAYYSLIVRGEMVSGESVLIHAGAGGVGLAALYICLAMGCQVFTTVGSPRKRNYLKKLFPQLSDDQIFNSRDLTFEDGLLRCTNGYGVDLILNSLAEKKLQAGLRCLAPNGRFLEIGKVDFIQDTNLFSDQTDLNRTFHGVLLDSLFSYSDHDYIPPRTINEKKLLKYLVMQGIRDGTVKPLQRTVFERDQVEEAFRFMSSGKHIGKVVIKIKKDQEAESLKSMIPGIKVTYFSPTKSYIVIGGLGGFGLEVVTWLADKGARNIVISARRPIRDSYQQFSVNRLRRRGVNLVITHDSCSARDGVGNIIKQATTLGPVGGIFNTAVVYDDILFDDMKVEQFRSVLEPKVAVSLLFDELSRIMCPQLDYFVLFSSISCGRGNAGQTNYNMANSAMDTICENRFNQGLPGLSIQWGVVGDVGIVTERTGSTEVNLLGATSQRLHSLLEAMDRFLQSNLPVCLSYVKAEKAGNSSTDSVDLLKMVSRIFGIKDISSLDPQTTLGSLGIDSLIAVEMKQLLERVTSTSMSVKDIRDLTIATLFEFSSRGVK